MAEIPLASIEIDQCLFGYDDGHKILATSSRFAYDAASHLLTLSDLPSGVNLGQNEALWTGAPIPKLKAYALLRTWSAPEMPRPGCVWSHALILKNGDIARLLNLDVLRQLASRPSAGEHVRRYTQPVFLDPGSFSWSQTPDRDINAGSGIQLLHALYSSPSRPGMVQGVPGQFDDALFALWSQQWPSLRCSFSFRTAGGISEVTSNRRGFDLLITRAPIRAPSVLIGPGEEMEAESWAFAAMQDLFAERPTDFRRFIWRYGSDIRGGRRWFRFLAELFVQTRLTELTGKKLIAVMSEIFDQLPGSDDGMTLKKDLAASSLGQRSLLPAVDPLGLLEYQIDHPNFKILPVERNSVAQIVRKAWDTRENEILRLAELACSRHSELEDGLLQAIGSTLEPGEFLRATNEHEHLRRRLAATYPLLLDSDSILEESMASQLALLREVPSGSGVLPRVIDRLLCVNDPNLANLVHASFPELTIGAVVDAIDRVERWTELSVTDAWLDLVRMDKERFITSGYVESADSTRTLANIAGLLGHTSTEVTRAGPKPWVSALATAVDNVTGIDRQIFLAFLLRIALERPEPGCEIIFERSFQSIHRDIAQSKLSDEAAALLLDNFPELKWWHQWDTGLRFRYAVIDAYIESNLDTDSLHRLIGLEPLLGELVRFNGENNPTKRADNQKSRPKPKHK